MSEQQIKQPIPVSFAQLSKLIMNDIEKISNSKSAITIKYTKDQIVKFLENPQRYEKELRQVSRYLYNVSANYRRLILYFAGMLRFDYIVEPYDLDINKVNIDSFNKQYQKTLNMLETMCLPHEMIKVLKIAFKEDVFYGYEYSTDNSYFVRKLDPNYCRISSIEDGVYNFEYDFASFDQDKSSLKNYADEFKIKYNLYLKDKTGKRWQELDSNNTICIKINEELEYPLPPFNTVFESVFDIDEQKKMRKVSTKMDNYMLLTQRIPIDEKSSDVNRFLIDMDTVVEFHNKATQSLPDEVGLVTSPMPIEAIKLERKNNDVDNVAKAERDYYNAAGVSQLLFNSEKISSTGLSKSVITDEQLVFMVLKQIERWVNRKLKQVNGKYKFRVKFLETTKFNINEMQERYLKAAQSGMPVKTALASTLDMSPSSFANMVFLENIVLGLHDKLIPLSTSHTQSGKDGAGAPKKKELTPSGEITRETDGNIRE